MTLDDSQVFLSNFEKKIFSPIKNFLDLENFQFSPSLNRVNRIGPLSPAGLSHSYSSGKKMNDYLINMPGIGLMVRVVGF